MPGTLLRALYILYQLNLLTIYFFLNVELNEIKNPSYTKLWDTDKAMLIGKCTALKAKQERPQIKLSFHLKKTRKKVYTQSKQKKKII